MSAQEEKASTTNEEGQETQQDVLASELPSPDTFEESLKDAPSHHPAFEEASAGYIGGLKRLVKGIPDAIWVKNTHTEPIMVVSSRFRAHRLWTGSEINASADGGGLSFETALFSTPASKAKIDAGVEFRFPLWSRADSFGMISIYDAATGDAYIENDRIRAGYRVNFVHGQSLQLFDYKGRPQMY